MTRLIILDLFLDLLTGTIPLGLNEKENPNLDVQLWVRVPRRTELAVSHLRTCETFQFYFWTAHSYRVPSPGLH